MSRISLILIIFFSISSSIALESPRKIDNAKVSAEQQQLIVANNKNQHQGVDEYIIEQYAKITKYNSLDAIDNFIENIFEKISDDSVSKVDIKFSSENQDSRTSGFESGRFLEEFYAEGGTYCQLYKKIKQLIDILNEENKFENKTKSEENFLSERSHLRIGNIFREKKDALYSVVIDELLNTLRHIKSIDHKNDANGSITVQARNNLYWNSHAIILSLKLCKDMGGIVRFSPYYKQGLDHLLRCILCAECKTVLSYVEFPTIEIPGDNKDCFYIPDPRCVNPEKFGEHLRKNTHKSTSSFKEWLNTFNFNETYAKLLTTSWETADKKLPKQVQNVNANDNLRGEHNRGNRESYRKNSDYDRSRTYRGNSRSYNHYSSGSSYDNHYHKKRKRDEVDGMSNDNRGNNKRRRYS